MNFSSTAAETEERETQTAHEATAQSEQERQVKKIYVLCFQKH